MAWSRPAELPPPKVEVLDVASVHGLTPQLEVVSEAPGSARNTGSRVAADSPTPGTCGFLNNSYTTPSSYPDGPFIDSQTLGVQHASTPGARGIGRIGL